MIVFLALVSLLLLSAHAETDEATKKGLARQAPVNPSIRFVAEQCGDVTICRGIIGKSFALQKRPNQKKPSWKTSREFRKPPVLRDLGSSRR